MNTHILYAVVGVLAGTSVTLGAAAVCLWMLDRWTRRQAPRSVRMAGRAWLWCSPECMEPHRTIAVLSWHPNEPWAVQVFGTAPQALDGAVLSRELVSDGLLVDAGVGAVRVGPSRVGLFRLRRLVVFAFIGYDGPVRLAVRRRLAVRFLDATLQACPWNDEHRLVDVDAALDHLVRSRS